MIWNNPVVLWFVETGASSYVYFIPMKLDRYHSSVAYFILAGEIVYLCFILYFLFREFYNIRKERAAYFKSMWNILEVCTISLALLGLFCYVYQMILSRDLLVQYRDQPNQFLNFQYVSTWAEVRVSNPLPPLPAPRYDKGRTWRITWPGGWGEGKSMGVQSHF